MQTETCPTCEATLRDCGRRWLVSLLVAFGVAVVLGFVAGRMV